MSIEHRFDVPFVAAMALREKAIQQNYRPVIAVHKWFARRPGTLFRGLLLSEFVDSRLRDSYFRSHSLRHKRIADPFMGGIVGLFGVDPRPYIRRAVTRTGCRARDARRGEVLG